LDPSVDDLSMRDRSALPMLIVTVGRDEEVLVRYL
jgi:hypothetical protein